MGFAILLLIVSILFFILKVCGVASETKAKQTNEAAEELRSLAYLDYDGTLKVFERSPNLLNIISIVDDSNIVTAYDPEQLHIGVVSVGGVVSGGAYKTGGNYYISHSEKSGKSRLVYGGDKRIISRIWLTPELFNQAESSAISQYLDKSRNEIKVIDDVNLSQFDLMWKQANIQNGNLGLTEAEKAGYPSYEKCHAILKWLCSTDSNTAYIYYCKNCGAALAATSDFKPEKCHKCSSPISETTITRDKWRSFLNEQKIQALFDDGILTQEEYEEKKRKLQEK